MSSEESVFSTNPQSWTLSIDFGTSSTVAVASLADGRSEVVEFGGERRMPSVVLVDDDASFVVGQSALSLSGSRPDRAIRSPKRRLGDATPVILGGKPYPPVELAAAVFRHVSDEAVARMGGVAPEQVRLTHPATWNRPLQQRLLEAATKAGLEPAVLVPEPVAAALSMGPDAVAVEGVIAIYDLGGGTFDTTVVRATPVGFDVIGHPRGDGAIGGELFDEMLMNHVGSRLDADVWERLQVSDEPGWHQAASRLLAECRRVKEALSAHPYGEVVVSHPDGMTNERVTRDEIEAVVAPHIEESIRLLQRTIDDAGVAVGDLSGIRLIGGSSRMPIVARMIADAFPGVRLLDHGDPRTAVALGAALVDPTDSQIDFAGSADRSTLDEEVHADRTPSSPPVRPTSSRPPQVDPPADVPHQSPADLPAESPTASPAASPTMVGPSGGTTIEPPPAWTPQPVAAQPVTPQPVPLGFAQPASPQPAAAGAGLGPAPSPPPGGVNQNRSGGSELFTPQRMAFAGVGVVLLLVIGGMFAVLRPDGNGDGDDETATISSPSSIGGGGGGSQVITSPPTTAPPTTPSPTTAPPTTAPPTTPPTTTGSSQTTFAPGGLSESVALTALVDSSAFPDGWTESSYDPDAGVNLCDIGLSFEPLVETGRAWEMNSGELFAAITNTVVVFETEEQAIQTIAEDRQLAEVCPSDTVVLGGIEFIAAVSQIDDFTEFGFGDEQTEASIVLLNAEQDLAFYVFVIEHRWGRSIIRTEINASVLLGGEDDNGLSELYLNVTRQSFERSTDLPR